MGRPGGIEDALALGEHVGGTAMVNIARGQHGDAPVTVLGVVPRKEGAAECGGLLDAAEPTRKAGMVFEGLELGFRERVVIAHLGAAQRARDLSCAALYGTGIPLRVGLLSGCRFTGFDGAVS